ncbi:MAG: S9 family peptidase [Desulfuromonadales bacterium]
MKNEDGEILSKPVKPIRGSAFNRALITLIASVLILWSTGCSDDSHTESEALSPLTAADVDIEPPIAEKREFQVVAPHGATRQDEYYWLRDDERRDPDVLSYLTAENKYADAVMEPLSGFQEQIYEELVGRLQQDESSAPYLYKEYWYYVRYDEGREYPIYARRRGSMEASEEIMLDLNQMAAGHDYYDIGNWKVSPDQQLLAYTMDTVGRRQYSLYVKDLQTGETIDTGVSDISNSFAWAADNATLFYTWKDPVTLLTKSIKAHRLGTEAKSDPLIYHEPDDSFFMGVELTRSEEYVCIYLESTVSNEQRCAASDDPAEFKLIAERERNFEYTADHLDGRWVIRTNWNAPNFKLMSSPEGLWNEREKWTDLVPHDEDFLISDFALFDDFIAIGERIDGLANLRILSAEGESSYVAADESTYVMKLDRNPQPDTPWLRYVYSSLITPDTTYELNVSTGERRLIKEKPVLGNFDKNDYATERLWATARDGTQIPVSIVYRKGFVKDGSAGLLQYGYGSYGSNREPWFNTNILSLLDRGMVYAIAHVRGGQEMGRHWYEEGKLLKKMNTFTDFVDVTRHLIDQGYAAPERVAALGGSAGGLLMGAIANLAPDEYRAIIAQVPFVDIVTTMLDESIPLTTNEYDEWGNPDDPLYYEYMLSYSPYDQIDSTAYPAMFVGTGLWDSQVQYWEPAKYVARLRDRSIGNNLLILRTQMEAGHGGSTGRFQRYRDMAEYFAFMLNQLGYN